MPVLLYHYSFSFTEFDEWDSRFYLDSETDMKMKLFRGEITNYEERETSWGETLHRYNIEKSDEEIYTDYLIGEEGDHVVLLLSNTPTDDPQFDSDVEVMFVYNYNTFLPLFIILTVVNILVLVFLHFIIKL